MEILQTKDKITFFSEWQDALRRVYLDGRKPSAKLLNDPTYAGYSTGHWEGDTLVVDTVALHPNSFIDNSSRVVGRWGSAKTIRRQTTSPGNVEDQIHRERSEGFGKTMGNSHTYRKATSPNDELREFACAEGLGHGPK